MLWSSAAWNLPNKYEPKGIYGLSRTTFLLIMWLRPHQLKHDAMQPFKIASYRVLEWGKMTEEGDSNIMRDSMVLENSKIFSLTILYSFQDW